MTHLIRKNPSVSIVTITQLNRYNCLLILRDLIKQQTYKNIKEWIIVNGCKNINEGKQLDDILLQFKNISNDFTIKIICIKYYNSSTLGDQRNRGNRLCTGDIIVCMDDDDYYPSCRVEHAVDNLVNSSYLIAGCTKMYIYDYDMTALTQSKGHGPFHSTNACFAYKRIYLKNHKYASLNCGEEPSFTNNFTEPLIQLDPEKTIVASAHHLNTYNKRELVTASFILSDKCSMIGINKPISTLIPSTILEKYNKIFVSNEPNSYDIIYLVGSFIAKELNLDNIIMGSPEYWLIINCNELVKRGKKICVYGNINDCQLNGVDYFNWKKFKYANTYNNVVIWGLSGLVTFLFFNIKSKNIILEIYDQPNRDMITGIHREHNKINKILFRSQYRFLEYKMQNVFSEIKAITIPNGLYTLELLEYSKKQTTRDPFRFCYITNHLTNQYIENIISIFSIITTYCPKIYLNIYYKNIENIDNIKKIITGTNLFIYPIKSHNEIYDEFKLSTFYLNLSQTIHQSDIVYIHQSYFLKCIPLISSTELFQECPGIHMNVNADRHLIACEINKLINNSAEIHRIHNILPDLLMLPSSLDNFETLLK